MTTKGKEANKPPKSKKKESQDKFQTEHLAPQDQHQNTLDLPTVPNKKTLEEEKEELENMVQSFMGEQSGLFSSVSRTLIFGIIGTIWVISYSEKGVTIPNKYLLYSLAMSLFYLFADVCHYFWDAMSYQDESKKIWGYKTSEELDTELRKGLTKINKRSVNFIKVKWLGLILTAILFTIGFIILLTAPNN